MGDRLEHTHCNQLDTGGHEEDPAVGLADPQPLHEVADYMNRYGVDKLVDREDEGPGNLRRIKKHKKEIEKVKDALRIKEKMHLLRIIQT